MEEIGSVFPEAVRVAIHANQVDSMVTVEGQALSDVFRPSFPMAMLDRVKFPGNTTVPVVRNGRNWESKTGLRLMESASVVVNVEPMVFWATGRIGARVKVVFVDDVMPGNYRVNVWLTEDGISKPDVGYVQSSYYANNADYPDHPLYSKPAKIVDWVHNHVLRESFTGTWGNSTTIPMQPVVGDTYELNVTTQPLAPYDVNNSRIVAFVTSHHPTDVGQRPVLNSEEVRVLPGSTTVSDVTAASINVYPNPATSHFTVAGIASNIRVVDMLGRVLWEGAPGFVDCAAWPAGVYLVLTEKSMPGIIVARH
jgi:hypothetical protein